jgi:hypothetical protein
LPEHLRGGELPDTPCTRKSEIVHACGLDLRYERHDRAAGVVRLSPPLALALSETEALSEKSWN